MNITINHQITFSTEVAEFLSTLFAQQKPIAAVPVKAEKEKVVAEKAQKEIVGTITATAVVEEPKTQKAVVKSDITVEQVRARVSEVTKAGKKEEAKALLNTYGAGSVTALSEEHYVDFLAKLNEL